MSKPKSINELLTSGGKSLRSLAARSLARTSTFEQVCAALPVELAKAVVSAGLEEGKLTIGVANAAWAARLRYTDGLDILLTEALGVPVQRINVKVVPSRA